jgi:foldase protein PrsA
LALVIHLAALAVAVTVAGPAYTGTIDDAQIARHKDETQALSVLIQRHWVEGEAAERGIVVTADEVEDELPSAKELKRTKRTEADVKAEIRAELLTTAIRNQITEPAAKSVTPDQVKAYVDANPSVLPARRRVRIVTAKNRHAAKAIHNRLKRGATWSSVGGRTRTFERTDTSSAARVVFRARLNRTARHGRYVFRVLKRFPERPEPRAQQEARAWEILASEAQQRALDVFNAQFTAKWRERTSCAPRYSHHPACHQPPSGQEVP